MSVHRILSSLIALLLWASTAHATSAQPDTLLEFGNLRAAVFHPPGYTQKSTKRWPALLFAHGFAGSALSQDHLLRKLAGLGLLVVAIEHSDPVAFERIPPRQGDGRLAILNYMRKHPFNERDYAYRPREFRQLASAVATQLSVDPQRVIFAGHSMGGFSILNAADNPVLKPVALITHSTGELNYRQGRPYFSATQLGKMTIPLLLIYGEKEFDPARGAHAEFIAREYGGPTRLVMLEGSGHLAYNDPTRALGRDKRLQQIETVFGITREFIEQQLGASFLVAR